MIKRVCPLCVGAKKKRGLGMMYEDCPECEGKGVVFKDLEPVTVSIPFEQAVNGVSLKNAVVSHSRKEKKQKG